MAGSRRRARSQAALRSSYNPTSCSESYFSSGCMRLSSADAFSFETAHVVVVARQLIQSLCLFSHRPRAVLRHWRLHLSFSSDVGPALVEHLLAPVRGVDPLVRGSARYSPMASWTCAFLFVTVRRLRRVVARPVRLRRRAAASVALSTNDVMWICLGRDVCRRCSVRSLKEIHGCAVAASASSETQLYWQPGLSSACSSC